MKIFRKLVAIVLFTTTLFCSVLTANASASLNVKTTKTDQYSLTVSDTKNIAQVDGYTAIFDKENMTLSLYNEAGDLINHVTNSDVQNLAQTRSLASHSNRTVNDVFFYTRASNWYNGYERPYWYLGAQGNNKQTYEVGMNVNQLWEFASAINNVRYAEDNVVAKFGQAGLWMLIAAMGTFSTAGLGAIVVAVLGATISGTTLDEAVAMLVVWINRKSTCQTAYDRISTYSYYY